MSNILVRTLSGAVFIAVIIGAVLLGPWPFLILFFIISILSQLEFYKLVKNYSVNPSIVIGLITGMALYATTALILVGELGLNFILIIIPLLTLVFTVELYRKTAQPFINIGITILGVIYAVVPFVLLALTAFFGGMEYGYTPKLILGILILQWSSDTGQYLAGRAFGKHQLFARISPKKTWEGFIGGFFFALIFTYIISIYFTELTLINWIIVTAIIVVFGTLGDLVESLFKRSIDVKDSGSFMPGHGGFLDRFDGLIGAIPYVYFYIAFFC